MRRIIAILLLLLLAAAGCGCTPALPEDDPAGTAEALKPIPFDNRFMSAFADIAETEDAYYLHSSFSGSNYLYYYDKASGESGVLCGKPEC
jgi:hypothetical protein